MPPEAPKFDDRLKAIFGATALFVFWALVAIVTAVEKPLFGQRQLSVAALNVFTIGAFALMVYFGLLAVSDNVRALFELLTRTTRTGAAENEDDPADAGDLSPGRFRRIVANLWVPVTLSFLLAGWLTYASGGMTNSPYGQVPIAMMFIGQSIYDVRPIELGVGIRTLGAPMFLGHIARLYWYPLLILVFLLFGVVLLQAYRPLVTRPAPTAEYLLVTLLSFFLCMCVTFVTRLSDRNAAQGTS